MMLSQHIPTTRLTIWGLIDECNLTFTHRDKSQIYAILSMTSLTTHTKHMKTHKSERDLYQWRDCIPFTVALSAIR